MLILGLDVSTSVTGVCIVDSEIEPVDGNHIKFLDRIDFKGCDTLWEKADLVQSYLLGLRDADFSIGKIDRIAVEEPLMGFRTGMSSAQTITMLMRFNGIVSYIARKIFAQEPEYISSGHARKVCGIKLQKTAIGGPQKEQVFSHMQRNDLKHVQWQTKKNGNIVDWSRDATDAYCIARAACIEGKVISHKRKK